ncbi:MAG: hypothetical protein ACLUR5_17565 [Eubacterium ventriosum]
MWGFIIALISGALMSVQGVLTRRLRKVVAFGAASSWSAANGFYRLYFGVVYYGTSKCVGYVSYGK